MSIRVLFGFLVTTVWLLVLGCAKDDLAASQDLWNTVVSTYITQGQLDGIDLNVVDYEGIRRSFEYYEYLSAIETVDTKNFNRNEVYGFFMNVYNAFAIKMILKHSCDSCQPIKSITDIGDILSPVWTMKAGYAAGRSWSLNDVENYLRNPKPFKLVSLHIDLVITREDPRVHACIVCASISCPNLRTTAYDTATIDEQMTDQMKQFLQNNKKGLLLDQDNKTIFLSRIFLWFAADFINHSGSVKNFVMQYAPSEVVNFLKANDVKFQYFDYNWNLNGQVKCNCTV